MFLSIEALASRKRKTFETRYRLNKNKIYLFTCMLITFILFASSQIVGRVPTVNDAFNVFRKIAIEHNSPYIDLTTLAYSLIGIAIILFKDFKDEFYPGRLSFFYNKNILVRYSAYLSVMFLIILFGVFKGNSFIYFQF
jgi:hypothetical protein